MANAVENLEKLERRLTITIPVTDITTEVEKRLKERARTAKAPGFRPGKVPMKTIKLATYASRCIENEILMYFRSQRKLQGEVSLSDAIDTDKEGGSLYLLDVVGTDDTMLSDLQDREEQLLLRRLVRDCLTEREADIIRRRYGLEGHPPQTQRQVAAVYGISRSYVSRIEKRALEKLEKELRKG